ncbi:MAG: N-(5'-phosphoribosyl)anthranilate isomerase [Pseudomonadota bacterium]
MSNTSRLVPAEVWMQQVFEAKSARQGGVVRRSRRDIERTAGWPKFEAELRRRGYHAVEISDQVVVFCNNAPIRILC